MGDREKASLRLQFNPQIRLEFHGATITSDAGLLAFRELDTCFSIGAAVSLVAGSRPRPPGSTLQSRRSESWNSIHHSPPAARTRQIGIKHLSEVAVPLVFPTPSTRSPLFLSTTIRTPCASLSQSGSGILHAEPCR